jgi:hypothetical protein
MLAVIKKIAIWTAIIVMPLGFFLLVHEVTKNKKLMEFLGKYINKFRRKQ